ncbi:MAG: hypothetical protein JNL74_16645 [Fibrobacteres bacterium]|nr:hypothetical protein [Fibrobacterota bacterium]
MKKAIITITAALIVLLQAVPLFADRGTEQEAMLQLRIQRNTERWNLLSQRVERVKEGLKVVPQDKVDPIKARYENFIVEMRSLKSELDALVGSTDYVRANAVLDAIGLKMLAFSEALVIVEQRLVAFMQEMRLHVVKVQKAIERTDKAIGRAALIVKKTEKGEEAFPGLRRAFETQEDAKQKFAAKEFRAAMDLTLKAREILENTIKSALDADDIEELVERAVTFWENTNRMIARIESELDGKDNGKAVQLIEKAKELQAQAKEQYTNKNARLALNSSVKARRIVQGMVKVHQKAGNIEAELARAESRLEQAEAIVGAADNDRADKILESGRSQIEQAKELALNGKNENAAARLVAGMKLIAKAVDVAEGPKDELRHAVVVQINRTERIVNKASDIADSERGQNAVAVAKELLKEAKEAAKAQDAQKCLRLLDKATDIAFKVIVKEEKRD